MPFSQFLGFISDGNKMVHKNGLCLLSQTEKHVFSYWLTSAISQLIRFGELFLFFVFLQLQVRFL